MGIEERGIVLEKLANQSFESDIVHIGVWVEKIKIDVD